MGVRTTRVLKFVVTCSEHEDSIPWVFHHYGLTKRDTTFKDDVAEERACVDHTPEGRVGRRGHIRDPRTSQIPTQLIQIQVPPP